MCVRMYLYIWTQICLAMTDDFMRGIKLCVFVCVVYLHPSSSSVSRGPRFGGRDGLICCQRLGGQMMWEARP